MKFMFFFTFSLTFMARAEARSDEYFEGLSGYGHCLYLEKVWLHNNRSADPDWKPKRTPEEACSNIYENGKPVKSKELNEWDRFYLDEMITLSKPIYRIDTLSLHSLTNPCFEIARLVDTARENAADTKNCPEAGRLEELLLRRVGKAEQLCSQFEENFSAFAARALKLQGKTLSQAQLKEVADYERATSEAGDKMRKELLGDVKPLWDFLDSKEGKNRSCFRGIALAERTLGMQGLLYHELTDFRVFRVKACLEGPAEPGCWEFWKKAVSR